jgi:hypothetical protein
MSVTITSLNTTDLPLEYVRGSSVRKKMFFMDGTASAITDTVTLTSYIDNIKSLDCIFPNIAPALVVTTSAAGTVTAQTQVTGSVYTSAGVITPGTTTFGLAGVITIY